MWKDGHLVQFQVSGRVFRQKQVSVLRGALAGVQDLHDPGGWHPAAKQVRHGTHKDGLRLLLALRLVQPVAVHGRLEPIGVWRGLDLAFQDVEAAHGGAVLHSRVKTVRGASGVAVRAPVAAPSNGVPRHFRPVNFRLVHRLRPPSTRSRYSPGSCSPGSRCKCPPRPWLRPGSWPPGPVC